MTVLSVITYTCVDKISCYITKYSLLSHGFEYERIIYKWDVQIIYRILFHDIWSTVEIVQDFKENFSYI